MTKTMRVLSLGAVLLAFALSACSGKTELTQIVVVVASDLKVPDDIDHVVIDVTGGATSMPHADANLTTQPLPRSIGIVHEGGPLGPITVRVRGQKGNDLIVERIAVVSFVLGKSLELRMPLERDCAGKLSCETGMTCAGGSCTPAAIGTLPAFGGSISDFDAGGGGDARVNDAAASGGRDAGIDAAGGTISDAGSDAANGGSDTGTQQNQKPVCTIDAPSDGDSFKTGTTIAFSATCTDPETGPLTTGLRWRSSLDGAIGMRPSFTGNNLTAGTHTISLCVNDPTDSTLVGCATPITIHLTVLAPITASIDSVTQGANSRFVTGTAIDLSGSGTGSGTLSFSWTDSLGGLPGTGPNFAMTMPVLGKHTVLLQVQDSLNRSAKATRSFDVFAPGHNKLIDTFTKANTTFSGNGSARLDVVVSDTQGKLYVADGSKQIYSVVGSDPTASAVLALAAPPSPDVVQSILLDAADSLVYVSTKKGYEVCDYTVAGGIGSSCNGYQGGSLPSNDVRAIVRAHINSMDYLVVGTKQGLFRATSVTGSTTGSSKLNDEITDLVVVGDRVWATTNGAGLYSYNPMTNNTQVNSALDAGAPSDNLTCLAATATGTLWVGSDMGIGHYVPNSSGGGSNGTWTVWSTASAPAPGLPSNDVRDIAVAHPTIASMARDVIWIATAAGVSRFDPSIPSFTTFTTADGLPSNSVRALTVLPNGSIAFATDAGLAIYAGP